MAGCDRLDWDKEERESQQQPAAEAGITVVTWNLQWFPGLLQEVADWDSVEELVSVLPALEPHIVSNFRGRGAFAQQQLAIASRFISDIIADRMGADSMWRYRARSLGGKTEGHPRFAAIGKPTRGHAERVVKHQEYG